MIYKGGDSMDFSRLKEHLKSRKVIYAIGGIAAVVVITVGVIIGVTTDEPVIDRVNGNDVAILEEVKTEEVQAMEGSSQEETGVKETEVQETTMTSENETVETESMIAEVEEQVKDTKVADQKSSNKTTNKTTQVVEEQQVPMTQGMEVQEAPVTNEVKKEVKKEEQKQNLSSSVTNNNSNSTSQNTSNNDQSNQEEVKPPVVENEKKDEYHLVWEENFDGDKLNLNDWNYEYHEPGWVNHELQEYVDSPENIYLKDGKLVIQALKHVDEKGNVTYTSGRINTQHKHDYTYGRFEARAKVPNGKGFLPAFWMMPTEESFYGQWPKCGEIDIMEVLGDKLTTSHGTLHFGEPHTMRQGGYTLKTGDFASEFHVFACEWEPGEIRFYVDGNLFYKTNDWFTKREGFGEVAYPAPYDQPFYMILNLAVGGDWPGYPDADAVFEENAQLVVDYVKVYQKDSYDENVEKPVTELVFREADETGNYVLNGDFADGESLSDGKSWEFLLAGTGAATTEIKDNQLHIYTTNAGNLDYSVQIVQPNQPLEKGYQYQLSFDACADEERTIITGITAPDDGYKRYLNDTKLSLQANEMKHYKYTFDMKDKSDANGRVEFNLGNQGSTATVHITNVRLEKLAELDLSQEEKTVLPDGNYVYNGQFQEGIGRLAYWKTENDCENVQVSVTNEQGTRELKVVVPTTVTGLEQVKVKQSNIAISGGKTYVLSFDAYADRAKTIQTTVAGKIFDSAVTTSMDTYKYTFVTENDLKGSDLCFLLGVEGTVFIDNVRIQEDGMLVNGDFSNGLTGYEIYCHEASKTSYGVDELNENGAFCMDIENTGDMDWHIQLKQNNVTLEEGKWYKISFDAKSTLERKIMYALQRDGSVDNNWIPYSGTQVIDVAGDYKRYEATFLMECATDEKTILSISMGAVSGTQITQKHRVAIDNIVLEEVSAPEKEDKPNEPENPSDTPSNQPTENPDGEMIQNGNFANGSDHWIAPITSPGEATVDFSDGKVKFTVTNPGTADWNVQLKQEKLCLENGATYDVSFKIKSTEARTVKFALLNPNAGYDWYGGADLTLEAGVEKEFKADIYVEKATADTIEFVISMGMIAGVDTPNSEIEICEISLKKVDAKDDASAGEDLMRGVY